jgi:frataxin-like iron-binding protein CyaY
MNDNEFNALADAALQAIEAGLERSGADLDFAMVSDQVLADRVCRRQQDHRQSPRRDA